ncbi:GTPase HflX [Rubrobacter marinus]|uniref:GTPase HflX n=1 Tax=Rubrobacter marinus TaxID=2653852 RepID=A0A6G8PXF9_9ACTN|nr:GTPase HflX [Rubrobacter marinus]QIN78912.1 GTPase HflX [Rubrobacter marinus]
MVINGGQGRDGAEGEAEERVVLVAAGEDRELGELGRLVETLGLGVVGELEQGRRDGVGYLGRGKRQELRALVEETGAGFVVADDELTASQARVLEGDAGVPVVDRTALIIRIFAEHARDAASRMEVELAELTYRLPRIKGGNRALSRLGGGGAGGGGARRGSGEQQLEYDRRVIRERMSSIGRRLEAERSNRAVRGSRLKKAGPPTVSLVGYTNAGKTTILNALSGETRSTADRLFETLETTTRLVSGAPASGSNGASDGAAGPDFVVTDTVGFIRKLPTQLVHSFAATLEAAREADLIVVCANAGGGMVELREELDSVVGTLEEAGIPTKDALLCLNKIDLLDEGGLAALERDYPDAVRISAVRSVAPLARAVRRRISGGFVRAEILIPHEEYGKAARLYGSAEIHAEKSTEEGVWMDVTLPKQDLPKYARFMVAV